jgi:hypothetical protein
LGTIQREPKHWSDIPHKPSHPWSFTRSACLTTSTRPIPFPPRETSPALLSLPPSSAKMMSGGGYSALDDPKPSGSVPVSRHPPRLALPPPLARHLPHSFSCPRTAGGDGARSADHQVHRLQPADLPAVRRQGQDLRRVPPAHRRRRSDLAAPAPRSLRSPSRPTSPTLTSTPPTSSRGSGSPSSPSAAPSPRRPPRTLTCMLELASALLLRSSASHCC